jgi:hypothetical protein
MDTISNIAAAARNSVFGGNAPAAQSGTEPPTSHTPGEGTTEAPYDSGNVPEQNPTQPGTEPPSGGPAGKGTAEAPFDRGNEPEQIQVTGSTADTTSKPDPLPSNTTPASKIDKPDPSAPSELKSAVDSNDATNSPATKVISNSSTSESESKPKKTGTAKPGSHSALFGLGTKGEGGGTIHPPKSSAELPRTIDEAGEESAEQAQVEKKVVDDDDDTGGYVGFKKAAMEEEEKKRNGGAGKAPAPAVVEEEREPSTSTHLPLSNPPFH